MGMMVFMFLFIISQPILTQEIALTSAIIRADIETIYDLLRSQSNQLLIDSIKKNSRFWQQLTQDSLQRRQDIIDLEKAQQQSQQEICWNRVCVGSIFVAYGGAQSILNQFSDSDKQYKTRLLSDALAIYSILGGFYMMANGLKKLQSIVYRSDFINRYNRRKPLQDAQNIVGIIAAIAQDSKNSM